MGSPIYFRIFCQLEKRKRLELNHYFSGESLSSHSTDSDESYSHHYSKRYENMEFK